MNEAETRAELIDPALKAAGWGVVAGSRVLAREYNAAHEVSLGFNPRPPQGAGAAFIVVRHAAERYVSILARPGGRALQGNHHTRGSWD